MDFLAKYTTANTLKTYAPVVELLQTVNLDRQQDIITVIREGRKILYEIQAR